MDKVRLRKADSIYLDGGRKRERKKKERKKERKKEIVLVPLIAATT